MSTVTFALRDSTTMLRRNLRHMRRYPSLTFMLVGMPVVFLLLFVYVFGGTVGGNLPGVSGTGRSAYANYLAPGILVVTVVGTATGTAIGIAMDMTEGIIARFRTMAIFRPSILFGHVVGAVIQSMVAVAFVGVVALGVGFRPNASAIEWLAAVGIILLVSVALTWLAVALGLVARTVESASNLPMPLLLLPFFGSAFVPTDTLPGPLQWFAEHQPFTPIIETLRGLLLGTAIGSSGGTAVAWCVGIAVVGFVWARVAFERNVARPAH
jgi:ABC-2 type transport system permease protein